MIISMIPSLSIMADASSVYSWFVFMKLGRISAYCMLSATKSSRHSRVYVRYALS